MLQHPLGLCRFSGETGLTVTLPSQESYGEDPFFSGKMGAAVVNGVQCPDIKRVNGELKDEKP